MPIETIAHEGNTYPAFQAVGFASQFAFPFATKVCTGTGYDIGCNREEWKLPGAIPIDIQLPDDYHATNLPDGQVDYIFSSHCLEHLQDWVGVLDYWIEKIKPGGVLFLYLPHYDQSYWRPWSNRKHINILTPEYLNDYLMARKFHKKFISGRDLYHGFMVMAEKPQEVVKPDPSRMGLLPEEIDRLKSLFHKGPTEPLWIKAFEIYNLNNPQKTYSMNCRPCYVKVLKWHIDRQKLSTNQ